MSEDKVNPFTTSKGGAEEMSQSVRQYPQFKAQQLCKEPVACKASMGQKQEALRCLQASESGFKFTRLRLKGICQR